MAREGDGGEGGKKRRPAGKQQRQSKAVFNGGVTTLPTLVRDAGPSKKQFRQRLLIDESPQRPRPRSQWDMTSHRGRADVRTAPREMAARQQGTGAVHRCG